MADDSKKLAKKDLSRIQTLHRTHIVHHIAIGLAQESGPIKSMFQSDIMLGATEMWPMLVVIHDKFCIEYLHEISALPPIYGSFCRNCTYFHV